MLGQLAWCDVTTKGCPLRFRYLCNLTLISCISVCINSIEIHSRLHCVYGASVVVSLHGVEPWYKKFAEGCTSFDNTSGRPNKTINTAVHCVHALLEEDHCYTTTNLQVQMAAWYANDASYSIVHTAFHEHQRMSKVSARWVCDNSLG